MKMGRNNKGFTIIEVVLVLAIAGLIFLMAFIALPALQRAQKNTERRRNLSLIQAAFNQWSTKNTVAIDDAFTARNNNNGFCTFYKKYMVDIKDPDTGEPYKVALWGNNSVVDCISGRTYGRSGWDEEVHGTIGGASDNWAKMEVGDIQFDSTAYCNEDGTFNDDVTQVLGHQKTSGTRLFAIRMKLDGGAVICVDGSY